MATKMSAKATTHKNILSMGSNMMSVPAHFVQKKHDKMSLCTKDNCGGHGHFSCGRCRRLRVKMCRAYHALSLLVEEAYNKDVRDWDEISQLAQQEIEARLVYEYVFDIIDDKTLCSGGWLYGDVRDYGHNTRVKKLYRLYMFGAKYIM